MVRQFAVRTCKFCVSQHEYHVPYLTCQLRMARRKRILFFCITICSVCIIIAVVSMYQTKTCMSYSINKSILCCYIKIRIFSFLTGFLVGLYAAYLDATLIYSFLFPFCDNSFDHISGCETMNTFLTHAVTTGYTGSLSFFP